MPWESRAVVLSTSQRNELKRIASNPQSSEKEKCRALIVLLLGEGLKNKEIAKRLNIHENTVVKWRGRWTGDNQESKVSDYGELTGRPRDVLTPEKLDEIKSIAMGPPKGGLRWTVRKLAAEIGLPVATTQRALIELEINLMLQSGTYE